MKKVLCVLLVLVMFLIALPSLAVGDVYVDQGSTALETELDGIEVDVIEEVPGGFGLWWRGIRERLGLIFTFDSVQSAEKRLKYAEERMRIAELMAEKAEDPKVQERAQVMIERAQNFLDQVEATKEKWVNAENREKVGRVIKNIAIHQVNREAVLDRLEERLSEEQLEKIRTMREAGLEDGRRLMNVIQNENVSEEIKGYLERVRSRIEQHAEEIKQFNQVRRELMERLRGGVGEAKGELEQLRIERREQVGQRVQGRVGEVKTQLEEKAAEGDEKAHRQLEMIEKVEDVIENKTEEMGAGAKKGKN